MSSPIPSDKEGLIPDRLVSNETVNRRAAQAGKLTRAVVKTPIAAARQPVSRVRQRQSLQKAEARLQQKHGLSREQAPANRTNHRQQAREAKMMAKHAAHNQKSNVQSKGRGMSRG